jgi:hypothetical protein
MKTRLVLSAITIWTALIAANDVYLAVMLANGPVEQMPGGWPLNLGGWVFEYYKPILYVKVAASAIIAIWWLAAAVKPKSRPWLRLVNGAFSGWLLIQVVMVWIAVGTILLQVAGLQHEPTGHNLLSIIRVADLSWLILVTLCVPGIQGVLGEWACRLGRFQSRESRPTAAAEAA